VLGKRLVDSAVTKVDHFQQVKTAERCSLFVRVLAFFLEALLGGKGLIFLCQIGNVQPKGVGFDFKT